VQQRKIDNFFKAFNNKKIFGYQYNKTNLIFGNKKEPKVLTKDVRLVKQEVNIVDITIGGMPFIKKDPPEEKIALRSSTKLFRRDKRKNIQDR
jgi:hypothetical protein